MDNQTKACLARILGEIYSIKNTLATMQSEKPEYAKDTVEGLLFGIEHIIDQEFRIEDEEPFSLKKSIYYEILDAFNKLTPDEINNMDGFYSLPTELQNKYSRAEWKLALKSMKAESRFSEILVKIEGSQKSPVEFKDLNY